MKPLCANPCISWILLSDLSWCFMEEKNHLNSESHSVMSNSLWPHGLHSPWNSPGRNTGVGSLSLLQGIFPTKFLTRGFMSSSKMVKVTEFEELYNTVADNWNMFVGSGRVVQSRLALTSLTCIQSCVCGSGGDFHPDCLGLEQLTWASTPLCCLSSSSAASRLSHVYPSHGNGQSARQQVETHKGSWNLDLEMVPSYFHLILLAKVTWLNSKSQDWSIDLILCGRLWKTYIAKSVSTWKDGRELETMMQSTTSFQFRKNLWDTLLC